MFWQKEKRSNQLVEPAVPISRSPLQDVHTKDKFALPGVWSPTSPGIHCKSHLVEAVKYILYNKAFYNGEHKCFYEFGYYRAESTQLIEKLFFAYHLGYKRGFAFDSEQGLPDESPDLPVFYAARKGAFADAQNMPRFPTVKTDFIQCWFKDLNETHVKDKGMTEASLVHIDCDMYISTYQALDFMFTNKLIVPGTVICYDEFKLFDPLFSGGEALAHKEIAEKYDVQFKEIYRNEYVDRVIIWQSVFVVQKIG